MDWNEDRQADLVEFSACWFPIACHLADHVAFLQASSIRYFYKLHAHRVSATNHVDTRPDTQQECRQKP